MWLTSPTIYHCNPIILWLLLDGTKRLVNVFLLLRPEIKFILQQSFRHLCTIYSSLIFHYLVFETRKGGFTSQLKCSLIFFRPCEPLHRAKREAWFQPELHYLLDCRRHVVMSTSNLLFKQRELLFSVTLFRSEKRVCHYESHWFLDDCIRLWTQSCNYNCFTEVFDRLSGDIAYWSSFKLNRNAMQNKRSYTSTDWRTDQM